MPASFPSLATSRLVLFLLGLFLGAATGMAQTLGSSEQSIRERYGAPQMERNQGAKKVWLYPNGGRVVIANGVVVESNLSPAQAISTPAAERPPAPVYTPPTKSIAPTKTPPPPKASSAAKATSPSSNKPSTRPSIDDITPLGKLLLGLSFVLIFAVNIWFIVVTFQESVLWGIACLVIPFASLAFLIVHWDRAKAPFLVSVFVCVPAVIGAVVVGLP